MAAGPEDGVWSNQINRGVEVSTFPIQSATSRTDCGTVAHPWPYTYMQTVWSVAPLQSDLLTTNVSSLAYAIRICMS